MKRAYWFGFVWLTTALAWPAALEAKPQDAPAPAPAIPALPEPSPSEGQPLALTGYLLPQQEIELGIFFMGYGITDWLTVGLMPAPWVIAPILGGVSANLSVKGGLPIGRFVNVALEINPLWLNIETEDTSTQGVVIPINVAASVHPAERQNYSLAVRYVAVEGVNDSNLDDQEIAGTVLTRTVQVLAQAQYQLTGAVALYAQGNLQLWEQEIQVEGESELDDQTTVEVDGEASATDHSRPWNAAVGAHFRWSSVNLRVGVGYGNFFVPRIGLTSRIYRGVVPDFDFYVRF